MKYLILLFILVIAGACHPIDPVVKADDDIPAKVYTLAQEQNSTLDSGQLFRVNAETYDYYFTASKPAPVITYKYDKTYKNDIILFLMIVFIGGLVIGSL